MGSQKTQGSSSRIVGNKSRRQLMHVQHKREQGKEKREARFRRKKEEARDPELRRARLEDPNHQPGSIDRKRVWDDVDDDGLYSSVNLEQLLKRRRMEQEEEGEEAQHFLEAEDHQSEQAQANGGDDENDSMLASDDDNEESDDEIAAKARARMVIRENSLAPSTTSTNLDLSPESLIQKFPSLFSDDQPEAKLLITTSLNSCLHHEAQLLTLLFPNSTYVPRSAHKYAHKYSVREISKFAANRSFSALLILREDHKKPIGLDIVHLPSGPTFHFSISRWTETKKLPGHGNATNHYPELLLNNFTTPLGVLTARLFLTLFPKSPEFEGRQVVTLHNQRDYIFVRQHRYMVRDKRATEKSVVGSDGRPLKGLEELRAPLQEVGPVRFTLKLRRIDKGIGRAGSEGDDAVQWEWKAKMEKKRTRFNL